MQNKGMLTPKKSFILLVSMVVSSSIMMFLFVMTVVALPYVMVTGSNPLIPDKGSFAVYLILGSAIAAYLFVNGIKGLYRFIPKKVDIPPVDATEFNRLMDRIKDTNIGPRLMNHVMECESCKEKSFQLNSQASKHIEDIDKLT